MSFRLIRRTRVQRTEQNAAAPVVKPRKDGRRPPNHWTSLENRRKFLEDVKATLGVSTLGDWYKVSAEDVRGVGGVALMDHYGKNLHKALADTYPEHHWHAWMFKRVPKGGWDDKTTHRQFFDWLGSALFIKSPKDWYSIKLTQIKEHGGSGLIQHHYGGSMIKALESVYPDHDWKPWMFNQAPPDFWNSKEGRRQFFEHLGRSLGYKTLEDWYDIDTKQVIAHGGATMLRHVKSLPHGIMEAYSSHDWRITQFKCRPRGPG